MKQLTAGIACTCLYRHYYTRIPTTTTRAARRVHSNKIVDATGFTIDPACPSHGESIRR